MEFDSNRFEFGKNLIDRNSEKSNGFEYGKTANSEN